MKIAILVREETMQRCTGKGCLNAFFRKRNPLLDMKMRLSLSPLLMLVVILTIKSK